MVCSLECDATIYSPPMHAIAAAANRSGGVHAHSRRPDAPEAAAARACELVAAFATHAAAVGLG